MKKAVLLFVFLLLGSLAASAKSKPSTATCNVPSATLTINEIQFGNSAVTCQNNDNGDVHWLVFYNPENQMLEVEWFHTYPTTKWFFPISSGAIDMECGPVNCFTLTQGTVANGVLPISFSAPQ